MRKKILTSLWFLSLLFTSFFVAAQNSDDVFQVTEEPTIIGDYLYILEDKEGKLTLDEVIKNGEFKKIGESVPNLGTSDSYFWIKFTIGNVSNINAPVINIEAPILDELSFFHPLDDGTYKEIKAGEHLDFGERKYKEESFVFDLVEKATPTTYYAKIHSGEQMLLPISVGKKKLVLESQNNKRVFFGIYAGIILVMFFYNLFVWISTKDKSYLWYILHTLFVGLTQASLQGYAYQYLWPNSTWMANNSIFIFTCLVSLAGIEFLKVFLHTKQNAPRLHKGLHIFSGIYFIFIIMSLIGIHSTTYGLILGTQSLVALYILGTGLYIYRKGFQPAKFYLLAWGLLMVGIIIYVMKDFGVLPYNLFTSSSLLIGSALEVALLSFALANKINLLRQENEDNQRKVVEALKENERIVLEQNTMLEQKVTERTAELNDALTTLKNAQAKLVDSEKMSSLGQLTAGIAHEINNPVNFITSNIKPLDRDIKDMMELIGKYEEIKDAEGLEEKLQAIEGFKKDVDYDFLKEEVELLVKTIDDGAQRTSEIVKGLRNFSRVDEQDLKRGDIHVGIDSTLMLLRNKLDNINVIKNYGELPEIDCYMGKLNQVFMNIIGNAIHAMKANTKVNPKGELVITTTELSNEIQISIKDNGTGMDEETKNKVFEPFFTTKGVGQGTGLGLSIVFSIIYESHNGKIEVESVKGEGSEFIITLPKVQEN
jgi:signal transduction histidine kinase